MTVDDALIDPETGWNRIMVDQLVRSVWIAHEINPRSWSLHVKKGSPNTVKLSVGGDNVIVLERGLNQILVDSRSLDEVQESEINELTRNKSPESKGVILAQDLIVPDSKVTTVLAAVQKNHEEVVRSIAPGTVEFNRKRRIVDNRLADHVERISGDSIPRSE